MPTTIDYLDYRRDLSRDASHPIPAADDPDAPIGYGGLSAFNIPCEIRVHVLAGGAIRVQFCYSDEERGERHSQTLPGMEYIELTLGRETKKIIEIRAADACRFLRDDSGSLFPAGVLQLARKLPPRNGRILRQSAEIISAILAEMPPRLRNDIIRTAAQQRK